jgi:septal ring factor EnvC (AmiA/AmiB activator)
MNMKLLLPWLVVAALLAGAGCLYSSNQKKEADLAALRADNQQLEQLRAELEDAKARQAQTRDELSRLRKDQDELLRLRNEVRQLREARQLLGKQVQTAQAQAQDAQAQAQALRQNPPPAAQTAALSPEAQQAAMEAFQRRYGIRPLTPEQANSNACVANLRLIETAKDQWALDNNKPSGTLLTLAHLAPYLKSNPAPVCPAGGVYTLNPVGLNPTCTVTGHVLPK